MADLTLRDRIAIQAMSASIPLLADVPRKPPMHTQDDLLRLIAEVSYKMADAMIAARAARSEGGAYG